MPGLRVFPPTSRRALGGRGLSVTSSHANNSTSLQKTGPRAQLPGTPGPQHPTFPSYSSIRLGVPAVHPLRQVPYRTSKHLRVSYRTSNAAEVPNAAQVAAQRCICKHSPSYAVCAHDRLHATIPSLVTGCYTLRKDQVWWLWDRISTGGRMLHTQERPGVVALGQDFHRRKSPSPSFSEHTALWVPSPNGSWVSLPLAQAGKSPRLRKDACGAQGCGVSFEAPPVRTFRQTQKTSKHSENPTCSVHRLVHFGPFLSLHTAIIGFSAAVATMQVGANKVKASTATFFTSSSPSKNSTPLVSRSTGTITPHLSTGDMDASSSLLKGCNVVPSAHESNTVSLPSVAPREPPQFLSTSSECKRTVGRLCLSLCIRFLHQSAKEGPITICPDYVCELGVLFGGMIRRTPGCERRGQQHPPAVHPFTTEGSSGGGHGCGQGGKQSGEDLCNTTATGTGAEQSRFDVLRQPKPPAGLAVTEAAALENNKGANLATGTKRQSVEETAEAESFSLTAHENPQIPVGKALRSSTEAPGREMSVSTPLALFLLLLPNPFHSPRDEFQQHERAKLVVLFARSINQEHYFTSMFLHLPRKPCKGAKYCVPFSSCSYPPPKFHDECSCAHMDPVPKTAATQNRAINSMQAMAGADDCISSSAVALPSKPGLILAKHSRQPSSLPAPLCCSFSELQPNLCFSSNPVTRTNPQIPVTDQFSPAFPILPKTVSPANSLNLFEKGAFLIREEKRRSKKRKENASKALQLIAPVPLLPAFLCQTCHGREPNVAQPSGTWGLASLQHLLGGTHGPEVKFLLEERMAPEVYLFALSAMQMLREERKEHRGLKSSSQPNKEILP
ncbi:hypothetical protein Anapl_05445 [Anas platyrhynchos]|uniref:Uncharacterized protein n=1 Tax=Anas platyrhynchos TaxID=8839 RepID=R0LU48_ANAPL|nr:hypothetical protein Anapl_05445 [Anas platyrhynchos]